MNIDVYKKYIIPREDEKDKNCNSSICSECKGDCCHMCGCHISPNDLTEITEKSICELLKSGCVSIDWWEDDNGPCYYLRMRNTNGDEIDASWGGKCVLLTDTGCSLDYEYRGKGARDLIPHKNSNENCHSEYTKEDCKNDWYQYNDLLNTIVNKYYNKD